MILRKLARKLLGRSGQALAETVLLITLISAVTIGAFSMAGSSTDGIFSKTADLLGSESDPWDISNVTVADIPDQTYTGEAIEPELVLTDSEGTALQADTDYTVEYSNNIEIGTADVSVTGIGQWHGNKTASFNIVGAVIEEIPSQNGTLTYTGNSQQPSWNNYNSNMLDKSGDTAGTNAGEYTAQFTPKYGYVWSDGTTEAKSVTWTIQKLNLSNATVTCSNISGWTGGTKQSVPTVKVNGTTISSGLYTVSYNTPDPSTSSPYRSSCTATVSAANSNVTGSRSATYTVTRNSYTVTYNANNGSGAPSSQTKYYGVNLTLSSTKPSRSGYDFLGWSTSSSASSASYSSGGSYTSNSGTTLYAVWKQNVVLPSGTTLYKDYAMTQPTTNPAEARVAFCSTAMPWGGTGTYQGCSSDTDGVGNTAKAITNLGSTSGTIWKYCADVRKATGNNNWYIPALRELALMYPSGCSKGSIWSSSENPDSDGNNAYYQGSSGSLNYYGYKNASSCVILFR